MHFVKIAFSLFALIFPQLLPAAAKGAQENTKSGCCYLEISAGQSAKEFYLSKTGLFSIDDKTVIENISGGYVYDIKNKNDFKRLPIKMVKIFPKSPDNDRIYVEGCDDVACSYQYIISTLSGVVTKTSAGKYGTPGKNVSWSPDGAYLIVPYGSDGGSWIYLIRIKDGKSWAVFNDEKSSGEVDFARIKWINKSTFEIPAYSCVGVKLDKFGECNIPEKSRFSLRKYLVGPNSIDALSK